MLTLLRTKAVRLRDLAPTDMPANQFSYHLDKLISEGFVNRASRGMYALTTEGERLAGTFSTDMRSVVKDVKTVIMFYAKKDDKYLLFRWSRQPYLDQATLPHDRIGFASSLENALAKASLEKLGLELPCEYKMTVLVRICHADVLVSSMTALVVGVDAADISLPFIGRNGEAFLGGLDDSGCMVGLETLVEVIEKGVSLTEVTMRY